MGQRLTNSKALNDALKPYIADGWDLQRRSSGILALVPPSEILALNPDKMGFVMIHGTPSDHRHVANLLAEIDRYKRPAKKIAPVKEVIKEPEIEEKEPEIISEEIPPEGGEQKGGHRNYQCPVCDWYKNGRVFRQHVKKRHPAFAERIKPDLLTLEGLEQAATLSWNGSLPMPNPVVVQDNEAAELLEDLTVIFSRIMSKYKKDS